MPGVQTYTLIDQTTLSSSAASVTFSSIPQIYEDLIIEVCGTCTVDAQNVYIRLNGDTGNNYSYTRITGNGTTAASLRDSNIPYGVTCDIGSTINSSQIQIMSYSSASVNKTILENGGIASSRVTAYVNLWRSTAAVTTVLLYPSSGSFASGTTVRLFGVVA